MTRREALKAIQKIQEHKKVHDLKEPHAIHMPRYLDIACQAIWDSVDCEENERPVCHTCGGGIRPVYYSYQLRPGGGTFETQKILSLTVKPSTFCPCCGYPTEVKT